MSSLPRSKKEAIEAGLNKYLSGSPCKKGHVGIRYAVSAGCVDCAKEREAANKERTRTDPAYAERRREIHRNSKAKSRSTDNGKRANYLANKRYIEANREKVRSYYRDKRANDPDFKMASWCRGVLHKVLGRQNLRKDARCVELLGYSGRDLRRHIERQFTAGMCWSKVGKEIHIDHITPVAHMIRNGETRPSVIHALSNLRPMWAYENILKSDTITHLI